MTAGQSHHERTIEWAENWSGRATLAILAGIAIDVLVLFTFEHGADWGEKSALLLANVLIGGGLAMEYVCIRKSIVATAAVKSESDAKLAAAMERATKAELTLLEYRKPRADRIRENLDSIVEKMKPFSGTKFDLGLGPEGFREQWDFTWQLDAAFPLAGWVFVDWKGGRPFTRWVNDVPNNPTLRTVGLTNVVNVSLEMHPASANALEPAARALADALAAVGVTASVGGNNNTSANSDVLHVLIGEKQ